MKKMGIAAGIGFLSLLLAVIIGGCSSGGGGSDTYTIGGTVIGLHGTLVLQNNGGDDLTITSDGLFVFKTALVDGSSYEVTILTRPVL